MKALQKMLTTGLTLSLSSLAAYVPPAPGTIDFIGEFLYLLPSTDNSYFVIESGATGATAIGQRKGNDFDFKPGFRLGTAYGFCNCDRNVQAYYSRLSANQSKTVSGDFLWATLGNADLASVFENYTGSAKSSRDLLYERADFIFAQKATNLCGLEIYPEIGLEFAYMRLQENVTYQSASSVGTLEETAKSWGIGPQIGLELYYDLYEWTCGCPATLSINALGSGSLLASRTDGSFHTILAGITQVNTNDQPTWRLIPALHARVGFNYDVNFSSVNASLEIGYGFSSYLRAVTRHIFSDYVADGLCSTDYFNVDLQGLYVSASLGF